MPLNLLLNISEQNIHLPFSVTIHHLKVRLFVLLLVLLRRPFKHFQMSRMIMIINRDIHISSITVAPFITSGAVFSCHHWTSLVFYLLFTDHTTSLYSCSAGGHPPPQTTNHKSLQKSKQSQND